MANPRGDRYSPRLRNHDVRRRALKARRLTQRPAGQSGGALFRPIDDAHHHPGQRRRRRLSAVELQLPQLRRRALAAACGPSARTQSSIFVRPDTGSDGILFNASPDILEQIRANPALQPARGVRDTAIAAVVLIDGQVDHATGLLMLRERASAAAAVVHRPGGRRPEHRLAAAARARPLLRRAAPPHRARRRGVPDSRRAGPDAARAAAGQQGRAVLAAPRAPGARRQHRRADPRRRARHQRLLRAGPGRDHARRCSTPWRAATACWSTAPSGATTRCRASGCRARSARDIGHLPQSGEGGMIEWLRKLPPTHAAHADPHQQHQPDPRRRLGRARGAARRAASRSARTACTFDRVTASSHDRRLDPRANSRPSCASAARRITSTTRST